MPPSRWKTRVALPLLLVAVVVALLLVTAWDSLVPGTAVRVVPVVTKTTEAAQGQVQVTATGWLEPDPYPIYVAALAAGIVKKIHCLEGETVTEGQPLAELVDDDAQIEVRRAKAQLKVATALRDRAKADFDSSVELLEETIDRKQAVAVANSELVGAQTLRNQLDDEVVVQSAALDRLQDELERKRGLVESGAVSTGELRRLELSTDGARAQLELTRKRAPFLDSRIVRAEAELHAARRHAELTIEERRTVELSRADLAQREALIEEAQAKLAEAALRLARMTIPAPCDGVVLKRLVSPGSRVTPTADQHSVHLMHLYDPERLQVRVDVPLADAAAVGVGQPAQITLAVLPEHLFRGTVTRVVHEADIQKNTVEVKVAIEAPRSAIKPEMLARVRFLAGQETRERRSRRFVPRSAIEGTGESARVWIVDGRKGSRGIAARRSVSIGPGRFDDSGQEWVEVASGLEPGDWLIVDPPAGLEPDERVVVEEEGAR